MEEEGNESTRYHEAMLKLPLYSCVIKELIWLKKVTKSKQFLKKTIEDPQLLKDFSILKTIRADEENVTVKENGQLKKKTQVNLERQLKLYEDLQWSRVPGYFWPVHSGDYSPLSPDGEFVDRHGKLGLDFWQWNRETSPLGYIPPLCTCKRTEDCVTAVKKWIKNMKLEYEHRVCDNEVCRGMLYVPYSLLEIPLNRAISNGSEFAQKVKVPNETDVYCGNMKHTIILCTTSRRHEKKCMEAIELSDVPSPLIYDVDCEDFVPYFKKHNDHCKESPLMTVEPIDSDVSDSEQSYGMGQMFAIRRLNSRVMFEKYDQSTKKTAPVDDLLLKAWEKIGATRKSQDAEDEEKEDASEQVAGKNTQGKHEDELEVEIELKEDFPDSIAEKAAMKAARSAANTDKTGPVHSKASMDSERGRIKSERAGVKSELNRERESHSDSQSGMKAKERSHVKQEHKQEEFKSEIKQELSAEVKGEVKRELTEMAEDTVDRSSEYSEESGADEDSDEVLEKLKEQAFKVYRLIESFSSDRRPLKLTLRSVAGREELTKRSNDTVNLEDPSTPKRQIKVT
ncbi:conserved hypothetical protein [Theileria orientalis strain Shintoku]|uniref:Uncharacterized protein n=1 Tax=Theileria orientalis strain Shintoku TaxID=869250 RepID=J4DP02_THEOR|nr:conserved hypothetical protein [Theileria orientalis strain Shintoku]BAM39854.1 conserved hypothetical protein [Theileria orientalis strain Shintoku]|eukprot:XP_009690155.1 conserved hypothetical protein [Theileria orientalis strain Shintoku]